MILDSRQKDMWKHFWANDLKQRPLLKAVEYKDGVGRYIKDRYYNPCLGNFEQVYKDHINVIENTIYRGESFPVGKCENGPDGFGSFISGTKFVFSEDSKETNWLHPVIEDYDTFDFSLKEKGPGWQNTLGLTKYLADKANGQYLVATIDLHSNLDALSALRGPQNLCMDLLDYPEKVDAALKHLRAIYPVVYDRLYKAGNMDKFGSTGWIDLYCEGKYTVIQSDFICMISPEQFDQFAYPALEEEANYLDHCFLHLDGPGALKHLDRLLTIKKLDGVQWVSGAGQKPMHEWTDVFKKCQKAGKKLVIYGVQSLDQIKAFTKEVNPNGLLFYLGEKTEKEFDQIDKWLRANC